MKTILADPEVSKRLEALTFQVIGDGPEGLAERIRAEYAMWGDVVKTSGKAN